MKKPASIDDYLKSVPDDRRKALKDLRKKIHTVVPKAEECISYGMPAFRLHGEVVAGFLATAKGCSYFPFSGRTLRAIAEDVAAYGQTKGSLHFSPEEPLSLALVRKLLKARLAELASKR